MSHDFLANVDAAPEKQVFDVPQQQRNALSLAQETCSNSVMPIPRRPTKKILSASISSCLGNGSRLIEETYDLEFREPSATRLYLAMIAQEEFAKAFMLLLVRDEVVPFSAPILRAMNDHACKQLVGLIMDYVIMHWDAIDDLKAMIAEDSEMGEKFPADVGSALELLRYEKIGRWEGKNWCWDVDPNYERTALGIAEGKQDRRKQDALYVRIAKDGRVASLPDQFTEQHAKVEIEKANRYGQLVAAATEGESHTYRYEKAISAFKMLFAG